MKNHDEIQGKLREVKGRAKEAAGIVTGNERLEDEGAKDRRSGHDEESIGQTRRKLGEAIEELGGKIKR